MHGGESAPCRPETIVVLLGASFTGRLVSRIVPFLPCAFIRESREPMNVPARRRPQSALSRASVQGGGIPDSGPSRPQSPVARLRRVSVIDARPIRRIIHNSRFDHAVTATVKRKENHASRYGDMCAHSVLGGSDRNSGGGIRHTVDLIGDLFLRRDNSIRFGRNHGPTGITPANLTTPIRRITPNPIHPAPGAFAITRYRARMVRL